MSWKEFVRVSSLMLYVPLAACSTESNTSCGAGKQVELDGGQYCYFSSAAITETGFACPNGFESLTESSAGGVCAQKKIDVEVAAQVERLALGVGGECDDLSAPELHRPSSSMCQSERGPGDPEGSFSGCASDADCMDGNNGRCLRNQGLAQENFCTYDACYSDNECDASAVCHCGRPAPNVAYVTDNHACLPSGNCRVDADCGAGQYCGYSIPGLGDGAASVHGFYCTTCEDECRTNADCSGATDVLNPGCAYVAATSRWQCVSFGVE